MTTWREEITDAMNRNKDVWDNVVHCTLSESDLDTEFYGGRGGTNGKPFTLWTEKYVYFPVCYDGSEWAGSAPRHPCDEALSHQGGG